MVSPKLSQVHPRKNTQIQVVTPQWIPYIIVDRLEQNENMKYQSSTKSRNRCSILWKGPQKNVGGAGAPAVSGDRCTCGRGLMLVGPKCLLAAYWCYREWGMVHYCAYLLFRYSTKYTLITNNIHSHSIPIPNPYYQAPWLGRDGTIPIDPAWEGTYGEARKNHSPSPTS